MFCALTISSRRKTISKAIYATGAGPQRLFLGFLTDLDQTLLRGKIALNAASGIMPDGTPFRFAGARQAPAPLTIAENKTGENVVLALPTYRAGREDVIFQESPRRWRAIWLTRTKSTISTPSRWAARRCSSAACAYG